MREFGTGNPLITYFMLFSFILGVLSIGFVLTIWIQALPTTGFFANPVNKANFLYASFFQSFDSSSIILLFIVLILDVIVSVWRPSKAKGFVNIGFMLLFAIMFLTLRNAFIQVWNGLSGAVLFPNTNAWLISNYTALLIFFALVLCAILNFKRDPHEDYAGDIKMNVGMQDIRLARNEYHRYPTIGEYSE